MAGLFCCKNEHFFNRVGFVRGSRELNFEIKTYIQFEINVNWCLKKKKPLENNPSGTSERKIG
jgi:hypothetical protein